MNIKEIEETIHTLETRHPGLNEVMLLTLLRAGGWEDKDVETARMLFRSAPDMRVATSESANRESLPATQEAPVFEPASDEAHMIEAPPQAVVGTPRASSIFAAPEPVSLIQKDERAHILTKEELPHNLPLRPFETSEHIWPFSRYKDVFFGDDEPASAQPSPSLVEKAVPSVQHVVAPTQVVVNITPPPSTKPVPVSEPEPIPLPEVITPPPPPIRAVEVEKRVVIVEKAGDEKLVIMACVMLLAILLLLGYMYSNGRL